MKLWYLATIPAIWLFVASAVFAFRHPWLTETERLMLMKDALLFRTVEKPAK